MIFERKYIVSYAMVLVFSVLLSFISLFGVLGYEYSVLSAFFLSFISVFISAEYVNDRITKYGRNFDISSVLTSVILLNLLILAINFIVGLLSSLIKGDCNLELGLGFYLLITVITILFTGSLGSLCGTVFRKRGFIISSFILIVIVFYSIWLLYQQTHIFFYNPIIGYFPGSVYDKNISITHTLIFYRLIILLSAVLMLTLTIVVNDLRNRAMKTAPVILLVLIVPLLIYSYSKRESIGIRYSREYIQTHLLPKKYETEHFIIHYPTGTKVEEDIQLIALDHEWRYNEISSYLNVDLDQKINSYIYPDKETRKSYIGTYEATIANPIRKEIHLVYGNFPISPLKHELVHVMSSEFGTDILKISPKMGLIEGIAVASDWPVDNFTKHQLAKNLLFNKNYAEEIDDFFGIGFWYYPPTVSYSVMGSYSRFLIDSYGVENFKEYYRTGSTDVYGKSQKELINSWMRFLENEVEIPEGAKKMVIYILSEKSIFEDSCPRKTEFFIIEGLKAYKSHNFYDSLRNFQKAYELNSNHPNIKSFLAYSYFYNGDFEMLLNLNTNEGMTEIERNIINNLKTNALWNKSGYNAAYPHFQKLRGAPLPDDIGRELDIKIDLQRFNRDIKKSVRNYFSTNNIFERYVILQEILSKYRAYIPANYLLGIIYMKNGDYERAVENFKAAEIRRLPSKDLRAENLKLLGMAQYAKGDYPGSIRTFRKLINMDAGEKYTRYAENFISRSKWSIN